MSFQNPPLSPPADPNWYQASLDAGRLQTRRGVPPHDGDTYTLENIATVPVIDTMAPTSVAVGDAPVTVVLTGSFPPDAHVLFNNGPALSMVGRSATSISFQVDASGNDYAPTPGDYPVVVTSLNGSSAPETFTIAPAAP